MSWGRFRKDIQGFAKALKVAPQEAHTLDLSKLEAGARHVNLKGAPSSLIAFLACWRATCFPLETCMVVEQDDDKHRHFTGLCRNLRTRNWELKAHLDVMSDGILIGNSTRLSMARATSGDLGVTGRKGPVCLIIPNLNALPACHMGYLQTWAARPDVVIITNLP